MRFVFIALLASMTLSAASPEKTAKIEKLMDVLHVERITDEIHGALTAQVDRVALSMAQQAGFPVAERATASAEVKEKMMATMKDLTAWPRLKPDMIAIYDAQFSDQEIEALVAFFTGPVGSAYIQKSGQVTLQARQMAGNHVKEAGEAVDAIAKAWLEQHKPAAPAPAK